ncbi:SusC/RagA family TonB-linked outer membrane protein [Spongiimicrobium salis]|uniref:SusC/RagA family TonB-linked outer membrane protein n=1 Tax=Spongiimicrobium salis TaxID=1667022 RepID=UPI00374CCCAC
MTQKSDCYLLKPKKRKVKAYSFGLKVLLLLFYFGGQLAQANTTTLTMVADEVLQSTITGTVTDEDGSPLPGASVLVKGTTNGTQTDFDGNYTITADANATLVFSYIGYASQEIAVDGRTTINVQMATDASELDEVVVLGYSTQTRGDLTGSVASVDVSEANKAPIVNVAEALEGRATGVSITNNGAPGSTPIVRIRGFGTPNNNNPLYIIDGLQTLDGSVLNNINPNDIAQINVLKDGAASIYGARASNGVIIITTKNGNYNQDKANISLDVYTGFARATRLPDILNAQQLGDVLFESLANDGATVSHPQYGSGPNAVVPATLQGASFLGTGEAVTANVRPGGTNFLEEIFRNAPTQNVSATLSNGSESSRYSATLGYLNRQGIQLTTQFKRGQIRLNSEFKVTPWLTVGEHFNASFEQSRGGNTVQLAQRISPLVPVRDSEGRFAGTYNNAIGLSNATNPVADLERAGDNFFKRTRILGDIYAQVKLYDGLSFKTSIGGDINLFNTRSFLALNPEHSEARGTNTLTEQNFQSYNWTWTNTLNYNKTFGKHNINALLGIEANSSTGKSLQVAATGFLFETPDFYLLRNASGTPIVDQGNTFDFENTLSSFFGSVNYAYDDKYLLTATLRRDRSSRFIGDNQSDIFPAFSAGWVISNEDFFNQDGVLNRLKFKVSWGALGNQELPAGDPGNNQFALNNAIADASFTGARGSAATGAFFSQFGNPNITWETSESFNVGAEFGFLENSLTFGIEYFNIKTEDLIALNLNANPTTGTDASAPFFNLGSIENKGLDISLSYQNQTSGGFQYSADLNVSTIDNEVTELASEFQVGNEFRGGSITRTQVGQPLSSFFGRVVDGIYRSEAEVAAGPDQGFATDADGVGRLRYRDLNGDNIINDDDRDFIGSPHPDFTFGLNLNGQYKNWDISVFFSGVVGNDIYNFDRIFTDFPTFFNGNRNARVLNSFNATTNPNGTAPALSASLTNNETSPNSFFVEDGSFVRLKNLSIGYNFPSTITDKWGLDGLRLYVNASNLFTITGYNGIDPEIQPNSGANSALTIGVDTNTFPLSQIFTLGANLKL